MERSQDGVFSTSGIYVVVTRGLRDPYLGFYKAMFRNTPKNYGTSKVWVAKGQGEHFVNGWRTERIKT